MKSKTEELLNLLFWSSAVLTKPTFRNLTGSYESWAYRNGLWQQIKTLEQRTWVERNRGISPDDRHYRLTAEGRLHVLGGRDPQEKWARPWDGHWRLVMFDIPGGHDAQRIRLYRYLKAKAFGCLQNSVWLTPDSLEEEVDLMVGGKVNVGSLALFKAQPCGGESDAAMVERAWDFAEINRGYARHLKLLDERPTAALDNEPAALALQDWAAKELSAWLKTVSADPLLPQRVLPENYLGQKSWRRRLEVLAEAGKQLQTFKLA